MLTLENQISSMWLNTEGNDMIHSPLSCRIGKAFSRHLLKTVNENYRHEASLEIIHMVTHIQHTTSRLKLYIFHWGIFRLRLFHQDVMWSQLCCSVLVLERLANFQPYTEQNARLDDLQGIFQLWLDTFHTYLLDNRPLPPNLYGLRRFEGTFDGALSLYETNTKYLKTRH